MVRFKSFIAESKGIQPSRVAAGEIIFTDKQNNVWLATEWHYFKRFLDPNSKNENPEYLRAVQMASTLVGGQKANPKGIVVIKLTNDNNASVTLARYTTTPEAPSKIGNEEFSQAGYERRTKMGGQLSRLSSSDFLLGHTKVEPLRVSDNNIQHYIFYNANSLRDTIIRNMQSSKFNVLREPSVIQATKEFLDGGARHFDWSKVGQLMNQQDRIKFGIYLASELGYAFWILAGHSIGKFPGMSTIKFFAVPTDNTNTSYDSYLRGVVKGGSGIANLMVSSKTIAGKKGGARSTILPALNGMAKSMTDYSTLNNKFLAAMLPYFKESATGGRTIYPFMIEKVLGLKGTIPDPVVFWNRICKLHGKRKGNLSEAEMAELEKQVVAVQKKVASGVMLLGINKTAPLNHNAARFPSPPQWKDFSRYISDIFCDAICFGLNSDGASDMRPTISWQIDMDIREFSRTGMVNYIMKEVSQEMKGMYIDGGKQSAGDPSRNITWLGARPL